MIDDDGTIDSELLRKIAGVPLSEDHVAELVGISIAKAGCVGMPNPVNSLLLKKLHSIETSAKKLLRAVDDSSPETALIKRQFMNQEALNGIQDLVEWASFMSSEYARDVTGTGGGRKHDPELVEFVGMVRAVWRDAGGEGAGSYKSTSSPGGYNGPLLNLVDELLIPAPDGGGPSRATIHRAIERESEYSQVRTTKKR